MVDTNAALNEVLSGHRTMITLCSDSGLIDAARLHMQASLALDTHDLSLHIRNVLLIPAVYSNLCDVIANRELQWKAANGLISAYTRVIKGSNAVITNVDEFVLTPNFYFIYQGFNDRYLLELLHYYYTLTIPQYGIVMTNSSSIHPRHYLPSLTSAIDTPIKANQRIRIGFVSSHFKQTHSICKLYCNMIIQLANSNKKLLIYLYSATQNGSEKNLIESWKFLIK